MVRFNTIYLFESQRFKQYNNGFTSIDRAGRGEDKTTF
ncbi:MAG: hypothetical protein RL329_719 [Bacteroidota bacterium]